MPIQPENEPIQAPQNRVIHGDCLQAMAQLPDECVDLAITSPPYNMGTAYDGYHDNRSHAEYVDWQRQCLAETLRLVKPDGAVFYNHLWRVQGGALQRSAEEITAGFPVRQIIIWQRAGGVNHNPGYFLPTYEVIYLIVKDGGKFRLNSRGRGWGDCWSIPQEQDNPHPAPFPQALPARIIAATNARTVLDPFLGSGTTAAAAVMAKRDYIGIEQSALYCRIARERALAAAFARTGLLPGLGQQLRRQHRSLVNEQAVYTYIGGRAAEDGGVVTITQVEIATGVGVNKATVSRAIKRLANAGLIQVVGYQKYRIHSENFCVHELQHSTYGLQFGQPKLQHSPLPSLHRAGGFIREMAQKAGFPVWKRASAPDPGREFIDPSSPSL